MGTTRWRPVMGEMRQRYFGHFEGDGIRSRVTEAEIC